MIPRINFTDRWQTRKAAWSVVDFILDFTFLSLETSEVLLISLWKLRKGIHFLTPTVRAGWREENLPSSSRILIFQVLQGHPWAASDRKFLWSCASQPTRLSESQKEPCGHQPALRLWLWLWPCSLPPGALIQREEVTRFLPRAPVSLCISPRMAQSACLWKKKKNCS